jgi:actin cytoskeleton-regulatory complex protein SLA1
MGFIGLYRAIYDYAPQADNELAISEGDLLCVLEQGDDGWWKAKRRALSEDEDEPEGLIPENYVKAAETVGKAKALYEYTRQTDEEISFPDDGELDVYDTSDPDWTLVSFKGEYGYAPANYIELGEAPPPMPSRPQAPQQPSTVEEEPALPPRRVPAPSPEESPVQSPAAALAGVMQGRAIPSQPSSSRAAPSTAPEVRLPSRKQVQFTPEESEDEQPVPSLPRRPPSEPQIAPTPAIRATKHVSIREPDPEPEEPRSAGVVTSPPHNRAVSAIYDEERAHQSPGGFHLYNIFEVVEIMGKNRRTPITLGINIAKGVIMIASENSKEKEWTADKLERYSMEGKHVFMDLVRPAKSIDFHAGAKDTAAEIMSALGDLAGAAKAEGLKEVFKAGAGSQKLGKMLFDFAGGDVDEVPVSAGDEVIILDDRDEEWWFVRRKDDEREGTVPRSFVEVVGTVTSVSARQSSSKKQSFVEQNRLEEERLAREASRSTRSESKAGEVGPGLQLPERGSSLSQDSDRRNRAPHDSKNKRGQDKKSSKED